MSALSEATIEAIRGLQETIGAGNAERGFHDEGDRLRSLANVSGPDALSHAALRNYYAMKLGLITSEVSEALEELRNGRDVGETHYTGGVPAKGEELDQYESTDCYGQLRKPEGVPSEIADVAIRALGLAFEAGIDLAEIIAKKVAYNATRGRMHGGRKF